MPRTAGILILTLVVGAALGAIGSSVVGAQGSEKRTMLVASDLKGVDGFEVRMWRTDIGPGGVGAKHYHPGTECIYVLDGALDLDKESDTSVHIKAGEAHCVPPRSVLVPRNASSSQPYRSLVVMISPKGQPIAVPVK